MFEHKMVMIPGPTPVVRSIQNEMGREIQAFGDPRFVADFKEVIGDLSQLFGCSGKTFVVAGTGTMAMEMAIANVTKTGDNVLVVSNGYFGDRFVEITSRKGLNTDVLSAKWGEVVSAAEIEAKLAEKHYAAVTVTHVDTATGACADIAAIGKVMSKFPDTIYIVDGVCASAAELENVDAMNIDILFTGTQKAFGVCPGLMMLWASKKALARRESLGTIAEYYIDFAKWIPIMDDTSKYFATPAVNLIWALKESVGIIKKEGMVARYERHKKHARAVQTALEGMGFSILARVGCRAVTLSNVLYPDGVSDATFRKALYDEGVMVAGGLGEYAGKMFRLGHMGNIDTSDLCSVIAAIERALYTVSGKDMRGVGVGIYMKELTK